MKHFNFFKTLLIIAFLGAANTVLGQYHPLNFGPHPLGTSTTNANWFMDYVGAKIAVTAPGSIAGPVACKSADIGPSAWPDIVWPSIVNQPIMMDNTSDSFGGSAFTGGYFAGKIAVLWRGPIASPVDFGLKAKNAQDAGAIALVLINEYPGATPFAPGYTSHGTLIHIPVIMIGNLDGIAISAAYHASAPNTVKMTITPWGLGYADDLGILPNGMAGWHNYAIPAGQLGSEAAQVPYLGLNGAFVANFGTNSATNVKLKSTLSFTPASTGVPGVERVDSVVYPGPFVGVYSTPIDTTRDSIMAMFPLSTTPEYSLAANVPGQYTISYNLSSTAVDQYPADNTMSTSFYLTDSLFSKGRYDFVNNKPLSATYEGFANASEITWGPMYYVAKGGAAINDIQYSISNGKTAHPSPLVGSNDIYIFKWNDGVGGTADSIVQEGELQLISWSTHNFTAPNDTSTSVIKHNTFYDATGAARTTVYLEDHTWYYVAIDIPAAVSDTNYLGIDGVNNPYPRVYGRWIDHLGQFLDYSNLVSVATGLVATANQPVLPFSQTSRIYAIDSMSWTSVAGMIPSVAFTTTTHPDTTYKHVGVNNIQGPVNNISVYPVPASDHLTVSVNLAQPVNSITYKVVDGFGRFVTKETHTNVKSETFSINTSNFASGNYYLLINADGNNINSKKFTVIR